MAEFWITYDKVASLTYLVEAADEEKARQRWQDHAQFDFDKHDFVEGSTSTASVQLVRLEMLHRARNFEVSKASRRRVTGA